MLHNIHIPDWALLLEKLGKTEQVIWSALKHFYFHMFGEQIYLLSGVGRVMHSFLKTLLEAMLDWASEQNHSAVLIASLIFHFAFKKKKKY